MKPGLLTEQDIFGLSWPYMGKKRCVKPSSPNLPRRLTSRTQQQTVNASVIAWDIETVPDLRGFAAAKGPVGKPDDEVRADMGDKFPKLIYHSVVCIGALVAQRRDEHWKCRWSVRRAWRNAPRGDHLRLRQPDRGPDTPTSHVQWRVV